MDTAQPIWIWSKVFDCLFSSRRIFIFSTFIVTNSSIILFHIFSQPITCLQRYQLSQEPKASQTKFNHILPQKLCGVVHVAVLVVALKLVAAMEDRASETHNSICFRRHCRQAQVASSDHCLRRVCQLLMLLLFCKQ